MKVAFAGLLLITIFHIIFVTMTSRLRLASAIRHEAEYNDVYGIFNAVESLGASTAPLLLSFGINRYGFSFFEYAFAGILTVLRTGLPARIRSRIPAARSPDHHHRQMIFPL